VQSPGLFYSFIPSIERCYAYNTCPINSEHDLLGQILNMPSPVAFAVGIVIMDLHNPHVQHLRDSYRLVFSLLG
jgi:hypothetical protein